MAKNRSLKVIGKEFDDLVADMKKISAEWAKASGDKKNTLLRKLKAMTAEKKELQAEMEQAVMALDKDVTLQVDEQRHVNRAIRRLVERKIKKFLSENKTRLILEANASGLASAVQASVDKLGQELKAAGEDISDEEVQGAMLMAAMDEKGKIDNIDPEDVEAVTAKIQESRGYIIKESGALHAIEVAGSILGNVALMNVIAKAVEKATGKKLNPDKLAASVTKIAGVLKKVTGLPAKAMEKFFEKIAKMFGGGDAAQKIAGYSGTLITVLTLFALGVAMFPVLGGSPLMIILSLTGLIGKGFEIGALWKHIKEAIAEYKAEGGKESEELPDLQPA